MSFQVSPGVNVSEIDLTTIVPAVSTTTGGIGGLFRWGPVGKLVLVDSEASLVNRFGKPTNLNAETFFTAANFLSYGNALYVSRAANTTSSTSTIGTWNAVANTSSYTFNAILNVKNADDYDQKLTANNFASNTQILYVAKYPGDLGNTLKLSVCDNATQYQSSLANVATTTFSGNSMVITFDDSGSYVRSNAAYQALTVGDYLYVGNTIVGYQYVQVAAKPASTPTGNTFTVNLSSTYTLSSSVSMSGTITRNWEYFQSVDKAPGSSDYNTSFGNTAAVDEVHVVVSDQDGKFTGVPGTILEVYQGLSRATDAKTQDGATNYYVNVLNQSSQYLWWTNHRSGYSVNTAINIATTATATPLSLSFQGGNDGFDEATVGTYIGNITNAYDLFASTENVDVALVMAGKTAGTNGTQLANYLIDNVANVRKDCVVFVSPQNADVVNNVGSELSSVTTFRNNLRSTSYAVLDSGYKYQYDKYNDIYRWVPLNGDVAGLCVVTDTQRDPWWSPAGFNRGQIKNIIKLAYNPKQADRDVLYPAGVNPVVTFPGQGTILYGDKTLLAKPSAFDRINVRRLFIVLEKAIATASKFTLFEFNDAFTRSQFVSLVTPFLKDIQGRRGIYDFKVVCDETNNTGEVIDGNRFVGDIYIKPARSINFIQLNFVAVRTGVEFSEIVGKF
jgi:hypothetical protein